MEQKGRLEWEGDLIKDMKDMQMWSVWKLQETAEETTYGRQCQALEERVVGEVNEGDK